MKILFLARHGQSLFNVDGIVNGDPLLDRGLSPLGPREGGQMARQFAGIAIDLCATSEFPRVMRSFSPRGQAGAAAISDRPLASR